MHKRAALFLDRDGVINIDHGYVFLRQNFEFVDGIFELVAAAKAAGYLIIVVTNQSGIGRGYYTEREFERLMHWVGAEFSARRGRLDAVYYCPDHPEQGIGMYRKNTDYRKPGSGMFLQAAQDFDVDLRKSLFVGDGNSDMVAGTSAGIGSLFCFGCRQSLEGAECILHLSELMPRLAPVTSPATRPAQRPLIRRLP